MILDFSERALGDSRRCVSTRVRGQVKTAGDDRLEDAMLHIRLSRIAAEPAALDECVAYIEREVRPALEGLRGAPE
jgi:hypothetical protein